jgi:signal recognition particle subunit SEC65
MESHPVLKDQHNQYCENGCTTESNLYVQCNLHQNSKDILQKSRKMNPKVHMEAQKTLKNQSNPEQKRTMLEVSQYLPSNYTTEP